MEKELWHILAQALIANHICGIMIFAQSAFGPDKEESAFRDQFWRKVRRVAASIPFAEDLLTAYYCAFDRATPLPVKASLVGALAYFIMPIDAIPDVMPFSGLRTMPRCSRRPST